MRINKFLAKALKISRRQADLLVDSGQVQINQKPAKLGQHVNQQDEITHQGRLLDWPSEAVILLLFNKPVGVVCSKKGQNSQTVFDLLPKEYKKLNTAGRLDKDSSGLLLLSNNGDLIFRLTHPKFSKTKRYLVELDQPLEPLHQQMIADFGINLPDGRSQLGLERLDDQRKNWQVTMHEGRNRQIRRTFDALGYKVIKLHRTSFGNYHLGNLKTGEWELIESDDWRKLV